MTAPKDKLETVSKKEDILVDGYSRKKLLASMVLSGYNPSVNSLAGLLEVNSKTAKRRLEDGEFLRQHLMYMKRAFLLSDEEFCAVFFSEKNKPKQETPEQLVQRIEEKAEEVEEEE